MRVRIIGLFVFCLIFLFTGVVVYHFADKDSNESQTHNSEFGQVASRNLFRISVNNLWGYIDINGKVIIEPRFLDAGDFHEGCSIVLLEKHWGCIDKTGKLLFTHDFSEFKPNRVDGHYSEGLLSVFSVEYIGDVPFKMFQEKYGYINKTGQLIIKPQFHYAKAFADGLAAVKVIMTDGVKGGYIDTTGKIIIVPQFDEVNSFSEGMAGVKIGQKYGYIDKTGTIVVAPQFDEVGSFSEGMASVMIGKKYGYIDKAGTLVIKPSYDYASAFAEGMARVKIGPRYGYINMTGEFVIQPLFDRAISFSEGLAAVNYNSKECFIDKAGRIVIAPAMNESDNYTVSSFSEGLAPIFTKDGRWGYLNKSGKIVYQIQSAQQSGAPDATSRRRLRPVPCPAALRAPEQGTGPDCARRRYAGKPAPLRRARGSAPRLGSEHKGGKHENHAHLGSSYFQRDALSSEKYAFFKAIEGNSNYLPRRKARLSCYYR